jgi:hypothetical protein
MSVQWHLEPVIDPAGPVRGRDHQGQLDDLFLVELGAQCLQIGLLDILWAGGQEVGIAQDCLLLGAEQSVLALSTRLLQSADLLVGQSVPLTRSGVRASSKSAPIQDRRPEVGKMLELRSERSVGPDRGVELIESPQDIRLMRQDPEVRSDGA